ncbi:MAG: hypothetical protein R3Y16_01700 [Rikenellaceae bacterium]
MNRVARIFGFVSLWIVILTITLLLTMEGRSRRANMLVERVDVIVLDSVERGSLINEEMILTILKRNKINPVGEQINKAPLTLIESVIGANGFVENVKAYTSYQGDLKIEVEQRGALARILLNGYNCYITRDGYIFDAPKSTALNASVITGDYSPLFESGFVGNIKDKLAEKLVQLDGEIERVEREKYPVLLREIEYDEDRRELRKRFINRSFMESKDDFARRVEELREDNRKRRIELAYRKKMIDKDLNALEQRQERYRDQQKKLVKKCDDLHNLITFVNIVEESSFWSSEIVQIIAESDKNGSMRVSFAVRSGSFIVSLGELPPRNHLSLNHFNERLDEARREIEGKASHSEDEVRKEIEAKLKRLKEFYKEALPRVGWERYKQINVEFSNQVVCKR